ncbi:uncharacterized protein ACIBXB_020532 [Morphnus guianensis]
MLPGCHPGGDSKYEQAGARGWWDRSFYSWFAAEGNMPDACTDAKGHRLSTADLLGKMQLWFYGKERSFTQTYQIEEVNARSPGILKAHHRMMNLLSGSHASATSFPLQRVVCSIASWRQGPVGFALRRRDPT